MNETNGTTRPRVFVTQESPHDFSRAEEFGELVFLSHQDLNNIKGSLHNEDVLSKIRGKLIAFDPDRDWLVITGSPYITAATFMILGNKRVRTVKVLRWDNRDFVYRPLHIELPKEI